MTPIFAQHRQGKQRQKDRSYRLPAGQRDPDIAHHQRKASDLSDELQILGHLLGDKDQVDRKEQPFVQA